MSGYFERDVDLDSDEDFVDPNPVKVPFWFSVEWEQSEAARILSDKAIRDNLPALLRAARSERRMHFRTCICEVCETIDPATWERLGEALDGEA